MGCGSSAERGGSRRQRRGGENLARAAPARVLPAQQVRDPRTTSLGSQSAREPHATSRGSQPARDPHATSQGLQPARVPSAAQTVPAPSDSRRLLPSVSQRTLDLENPPATTPRPEGAAEFPLGESDECRRAALPQRSGEGRSSRLPAKANSSPPASEISANSSPRGSNRGEPLVSSRKSDSGSPSNSPRGPAISRVTPARQGSGGAGPSSSPQAKELKSGQSPGSSGQLSGSSPKAGIGGHPSSGSLETQWPRDSPTGESMRRAASFNPLTPRVPRSDSIPEFKSALQQLGSSASLADMNAIFEQEEARKAIDAVWARWSKEAKRKKAEIDAMSPSEKKEYQVKQKEKQAAEYAKMSPKEKTIFDERMKAIRGVKKLK